MMIEAVIFLKPLPKKRPRFSKTGRVYKADALDELRLKRELQKVSKHLLTGPLDVELICGMPRPKSKKNAKYHVSRPDGDNLLKFWADSANGILFEDDSQIVKFSVLKIYADVPYWQFRVTELEET